MIMPATQADRLLEFLKLLAMVVEKKKVQQLKSSPFYSLLTDESTDAAVLTQLVVVARCALPSGAVETMFLDICDIQDGRANTIEHNLLQCLEGYGLDICNLRGFGSNGAAVMVGRRTGVATCLNARQPRLLAVHSVNHQLAH